VRRTKGQLTPIAFAPTQAIMLQRFWFKFRNGAHPTILSLGCGVTAYDLSDAHEILREQVFSIYQEQLVVQVIADIDVSTLDEKHIRPNMGNPAVRGLWFPLF
jgi:hypothetical protein